MIANSVTLSFFLLQIKSVATREKAFGLIQNRSSVSVREVYQLIGMCNPTGSSRSSTTLQKYSTLYDWADETIQSSKESNLQQADSSEFSVSPRAEMVDSFSPRCSTRVHKSSHSRLYRRQRERLGGYLDLLKVYGRSSQGERSWHINVKEMMVVFLGLKVFFWSQQGILVHLFVDNMTTVVYLKEMGETHSKILSDLSLLIRDQCIERSIWMTAACVPRKRNIVADKLSHLLHQSTKWSLDHLIFRQVLAIYGPPQVDLFASAQNHQAHLYVSWLPDQNAAVVDAFSIRWQTFDLIYLFTPFSLILTCLQFRRSKQTK